MADIELVIKIPEDEYRNILLTGKASFCAVNAIEAGIPLPKGHGRILDEKDILDTKANDGGWYDLVDMPDYIAGVKAIIKADKEYEAEVITRGNCMMCGKELTEGLFFCKECEDKANSRK
jgi:hypothetical protein